MSAPRPYETNPFHSSSSVHTLYEKQFLYIFESVLLISSIRYVKVCLAGCTFEGCVCVLAEPLTSRFRVI